MQARKAVHILSLSGIVLALASSAPARAAERLSLAAMSQVAGATVHAWQRCNEDAPNYPGGCQEEEGSGVVVKVIVVHAAVYYCEDGQLNDQCNTFDVLCAEGPTADTKEACEQGILNADIHYLYCNTCH